MGRRVRWSALLVLAVLALLPSSASADIAPPWCGTPSADAAEALPDGTDPADPPGSFPHIPYYAIGCTLEDIEDRSRGRMDVEVIGESALGRPLYGVVINERRTGAQARGYAFWRVVRRMALRDPERAQRLLDRFGDDVKVPVFIQGGIHGNEYEGVDAAMLLIEKLATTRRGEDPFVDEVLDHAIIVFNPIQNPDGRVAGTRANGNGFDLNRDYLTQSQSETTASVTLMKRWLAPELLDLHGYVSPTLIEATTKPHNPSVEYDLWLEWNQSRIDANEAAVNAIGREVTRPINDWCADASIPEPGELCPDGRPPGPAVAEGWDDWGPFYTAMYHQHVGLDASTVEMCDPDLDEFDRDDDGDVDEPVDPECGGRAGARDVQTAVQESTLEFVVANRDEMLHDMLEIYIRGDEDAPRPACCPPPFDVDNNWMHDYPQAYVIPVGEGQRSDAEANRLVEWLLFNDIEVSALVRDHSVGGRTFERGSYVVWMAQPRRGLADTALSIGFDISDRIGILYAPPAAWSHGYLWGADTVTIADGESFDVGTRQIRRPSRLRGGVESGPAGAYALELDSPTAVRALNALLSGGVEAGLALEPSAAGPAGTAVFAADRGTRRALDAVGREHGLVIRAVGSADVPELDPIEDAPSFRVITGNSGTARTDQSTWVLRELGFTADPITVQQIDNAPTDPLAGYDLIFNATVNYPSDTGDNPRPTARNRLAAFFAGGGGYIGGQANGSNFLATGEQVTGLSAMSNSGDGSGWSGILLWDNTGGEDSVITGAYPAQDTLIADPPTWLTSVPGTMTVDGRLATGDFFAAGLFPGSEGSSAAGSPAIAHGTNTAGTARLTVFANNPLYRADPEREWPMVANAAYWGDGG